MKTHNAWFWLGLIAGWASLQSGFGAATLPDIRSVPYDLTVPPLSEGPAAAGKRVKLTVAEFAGTGAYHVLYLPRDWQAGQRYPVFAEYAGNGRYTNRFGDISTGWPEFSHLGYGISGGTGFIWICLPYVTGAGEKRANTNIWWGDIEQTVAYCKSAMREVCAQYGGDRQGLFLSGFSRGAIGCNYIGLHDDEIAGLWKGFIVHSHYDGVKTNWPYAGADRASALVRLRRLGNRPQFISQEGSTETIEAYLKSTGVEGRFTFQRLPYVNHTDEWGLRDIPERARVRAWLKEALSKP